MGVFYTKPVFIEWEVYKFYNVNWIIDFFIDFYSIIFSFTVFIVTILISIYSVSYMCDDKEKKVFFIFLFLFSLRIQILIFSFSYSRVLMGWDGLGITSFFLIIFYHRSKRLYGSIVTVIRNRLGDCFFIITICLILEIKTFTVIIRCFQIPMFASFILILTAFTKRAQLPFSFWLPKAIAAPTPVSSLVHSSTLVTAGVYLIFRYSYIFLDKIKNFISVMAFSTLLLGSFIALKRYDCKEIVAYSTLSQVGFMIFTLSLNLNNQAFFHLITHALFKSLLFICSGVIIHEFLTQDVRLISLKKVRPAIKIPMLISLLSIRGLPFLRGFYSKDYIIDSLAINLENFKLWTSFISIIFLSSLYRLRFFFFIIRNYVNFPWSWKWDYILLSLNLRLLGSIVIGSTYIWLWERRFYAHFSFYKIIIIAILIYRLIRRTWVYKLNLNTFSHLGLINQIFNKTLKWYNSSFFMWDKGWLNGVFFFFINALIKLSILFNTIWIKFIIIFTIVSLGLYILYGDSIIYYFEFKLHKCGIIHLL